MAGHDFAMNRQTVNVKSILFLTSRGSLNGVFPERLLVNQK